jgi:hypothetical protein
MTRPSVRVSGPRPGRSGSVMPWPGTSAGPGAQARFWSRRRYHVTPS